MQVTYSTSSKTVYFLKDHLGSVRATVDNTGAVVGYDDYDPWGYILAGRSLATPWSSVQGTAKNKFTGKEWDDEFGVNWFHFDARPYDPQIGRFLGVDRFADKYPSWTPYHYALNNPILFTDLTGDTVDVDPKLLAPVIYSEGEKQGQQKRIEDMTPEERQRYFFQQWWSENRESVESLFGIGGKYETTNINFRLGTKPLTTGEKILEFLTPPRLREPQFGQTTFGMHVTPEAKLFTGTRDINPNFGIEQLTMFIYFNPNLSRMFNETPAHEWKHVAIIFNAVLRGQVVPSGLKQHQFIYGGGVIPPIK